MGAVSVGHQKPVYLICDHKSKMKKDSRLCVKCKKRKKCPGYQEHNDRKQLKLEVVT